MTKAALKLIYSHDQATTENHGTDKGLHELQAAVETSLHGNMKEKLATLAKIYELEAYIGKMKRNIYTDLIAEQSASVATVLRDVHEATGDTSLTHATLEQDVQISRITHTHKSFSDITDRNRLLLLIHLPLHLRKEIADTGRVEGMDFREAEIEHLRLALMRRQEVDMGHYGEKL